MKSLFVFILVFVGGLCVGGIGGSMFQAVMSPCSALEAELSRQVEREQKARAQWEADAPKREAESQAMREKLRAAAEESRQRREALQAEWAARNKQRQEERGGR